MTRFSFHPTPTNKYRNRKVEVDGKVFDSQKEAGIYLDLKAALGRREIDRFETQVKFVLLPNQREGSCSALTNNGHWSLTVTPGKGKVVERECAYIADFVVHHLDGEVAVIDCKSSMTRGLPVYRLKKKLLRLVHGIEIQEV